MRGSIHFRFEATLDFNTLPRIAGRPDRLSRTATVFLAAMVFVCCTSAPAQDPPSGAQPISALTSVALTIQGAVFTADHHPAIGALVSLHSELESAARLTTTDRNGRFSFAAIPRASYSVEARSADRRSRALPVKLNSKADEKHLELVLEEAGAALTDSKQDLTRPSDTMEFTDQPKFTIAGVTDWTAVGGHGTDSSVRTSEILARDALTLRAAAPGDKSSSPESTTISSFAGEKSLRTALAAAPESFETNRKLGSFYMHGNRYAESVEPLTAAYRVDPTDRENAYDLATAWKETGRLREAHNLVQKLLLNHNDANLHRLDGEIAEKKHDPLAAVREFEMAVQLDPSESNYFAWGAELLLHHAAQQAQEVLARGADAHPDSPRILAALGASLLANSLYDQAAQRLCQASDLNASDAEPYLFLGRLELAAPTPLPCVESRLQRFAQLKPNDPLANYFWAVALWKRQEQSPDPQMVSQIEGLLTKAIALDNQCADAYLQLGILQSSQHHQERALDSYKAAIRANPDLVEAHYRLGLLYDRMHEPGKAREEFQIHDALEKRQASAIEEERRQTKQFLVGPATAPKTPEGR